MTDYVAPLKTISAVEFVEKFGSLVGGLFILYMMISTNFLPELFGCHLQLLLKNKIWAKHLVALLTIFFFVNVTTSALNWNLGIKFGFSVVLYVIFMFSQQSEYASQIGFIMIILIIYVLQLVRDQMNTQADNDKTLTPEQSAEMRNQTAAMGKVQIGLFVTSLIMIAVGHIAYVGKKKLQFRQGFSYWKMLVGTGQCSGTDNRRYSVSEALSTGVAVNKDLRTIDAEESARLNAIAGLFVNAGGENVDLKVPSGLSWTSPTIKEIVNDGKKAGLTLSNMGKLAEGAGSYTSGEELLLNPTGETSFGATTY
jgi:hypothetical protein